MRSKVAEIAVARASKADIPALGRFLMGAWRQAGSTAWGWTGASDEVMRELSSHEFLAELLSNRKVRLFLAKDRGRIRGFAANRGMDSDVVELAGVIVDERYKGVGIGTVLVNAAIRSAVRNGYSTMMVKTEAFNKRAIGFYKARGFTRTGTERESVGGKRVKLAVLRRRLAAETNGGRATRAQMKAR